MPRHTLVGARRVTPCVTPNHSRESVLGRGPSLHRRYPASTLLRPPPTPAQAQRRLLIPAISRGRLSRALHRLDRSPRFLTDLSTPAVPYHPGEPGRCHRSFLHDRCQASPHPKGWPLSGKVLTRLNRVHAFALRLTSSPSRASHPGSPRRTSSRLHGERAIPMVSSFQLTRSDKLGLAHRMEHGLNTDQRIGSA